jgi:hypothetical protein
MQCRSGSWLSDESRGEGSKESVAAAWNVDENHLPSEAQALVHEFLLAMNDVPDEEICRIAGVRPPTLQKWRLGLLRRLQRTQQATLVGYLRDVRGPRDERELRTGQI